jgi:predicted small secreted protein
MRKFVILLLAAAVVSVLPACNTIRGVGEDMSAVGGTLSRAGR